MAWLLNAQFNYNYHTEFASLKVDILEKVDCQNNIAISALQQGRVNEQLLPA